MSKRQLFPFYCKSKDKSGKEQRVGMEISEGMKKLDDDDYADFEGRVVARFFNTTMSKDTQIRFKMEPAEAYDVYMKIMKVFKSAAACKEETAPHKFTKDGKDIMTNLTIEKWVRNDKHGYAIIASRNGVSHNVSMREAGFLYAAEVFKTLSVQCNWQLAPADKKQEAIDALSTLKGYLAGKKGSLDLLKQVYKMVAGLALVITASGCAGTGPTRLEAARMQDESAAARTAQYKKDVGLAWRFTCSSSPSSCQENPHKQEDAVPYNRRNDRGFWQNFLGRVADLNK